MESILKGLAVFILRKILLLYDKTTSKVVQVNILDVLIRQGELSHLQFIAITRYLDVMNYYITKGDKSDNNNFKWQDTISYMAYGNKYNKPKGDTEFINLIESYRLNGYDGKSTILVDKYFQLLDGTHRVGLNIFHNVETISVRVLKRKGKKERNIDWYYRKGMKLDDIMMIKDKYKQIINSFSISSFVVLINALQFHDQIVVDLKTLCNVDDYKDMITNENAIKRIVLISFNDPMFRVEKNGMPYSLQAKRIESLINSRYRELVGQKVNVCAISPNLTVAKNWFDEFKIKENIIDCKVSMKKL